MYISPIEVRASVVEQLTISGVTAPDIHVGDITVIGNMMRPGGVVTVVCADDVWSYGWPPTGQPSLLLFLSRVSTEYLMGKLSMGGKAAMTEVDSDAALADGMTHIDNLLAEGIFSDRDARGMRAELTRIASGNEWSCAAGECHTDTLTQIYGDDWFEALPERPTRYAKRLEAVCAGVIQGCRQEVARRRREAAEAFSITSQRLKQARPPNDWMPGDVIEVSTLFPADGLTTGRHYTVVKVSMNRRAVTILADDHGNENEVKGTDEFIWMYRPSRVVEL